MKYAMYTKEVNVSNEIVNLNSLLPANNDLVLLHDDGFVFDGRSMPAEDYTKYGPFQCFIDDAPKAELIDVLMNKDVLFQYVDKYVTILPKEN